ncbi:hypothetical protein [Streptomyces sp. NPDC058297]|uniref:hypothetical protein n=1 Tax=Streptomyces sp. NPDC058297 TaxID=3346433 RepID=UPI0036EF5D6A
MTREFANYPALGELHLNQLCPSQTEAGPPHAIDLAEHRVHRIAVLNRLINEYRIAS